MSTRDYRDMTGGGLLILTGGFLAVYSMNTLNLGTLSNMGPGFIPAALGFILGALGLGILGTAFFRAGPAIDFDFRAFTMILASVLAFALVLRPFGLVPAVFVLTLIASRADSKLSLLGTTILAAGLSLGAVVIFQYALGIRVATIAWPW